MNPFVCELSLECAGRIGVFMFVSNTLRYFPLAGAVFALFWWWRRDFFLPFRIQQKWPAVERIRHELQHSFGTLLVFVGLGIAAMSLGKLGWNRVYFDLDRYGAAYLVLGFVLLHLWQETWFYWMHRAVHRPRLFRPVHLVHHKSVNPTPFAAYGFHPTEALLEGVYPVLFSFVLPIHPYVILAQIQFTMMMNIYFHSGYEFFPAGWTRGAITKWINTATHHNLHHAQVRGNYSLYLNFWDRIMGTNFPDYDERFEEVVARRAAGAADVTATAPAISMSSAPR